MSAWTQEEINQYLEKLKELSVTDLEFRKLCLENPNEAISKVAGKPVPEGIIIKFVENVGAHATVVLPDVAEGELTDDALDSVAGGVASMPPKNPVGGNPPRTVGGMGGGAGKLIGF